MDELSSILELIINHIKENNNIPPSSVKLWFGDFQLTSLTDTEATFRAGSEMKRGIIVSKYGSLIKDAIKATIDLDVDVVIYSDENPPVKVDTPEDEPEESAESRAARH